ncbi:M20/M25/M40 family metallo-hydrolase, partial [Candidatus Woesearchaeota archaeon]|nr:M20/M25/M40 family metallo-hydrolase [Candidatus Woesearchaeota archaeon]
MGEIVEITKQLIEFKTTSENPEELKKCIDFIEDYFKDMELFVHRFNSKKKPSVAVTLQDTKNPELFLAAHCDVVPADDSEFVPEEKDGRLYGRGAIDNKASVAICMRLMKYYSQQNNKPNIGVMFTTDEEIGGKEGVNLLLNNEGYSCKFAIVMDGGENYNIVHRHKGSLHIKMVARGKGTHGSRPWEGDNAIEKLLDF